MEFLQALTSEVAMRLNRRVLVLYTDDFSTFKESTDVATAYAQYGIQHLVTPEGRRRQRRRFIYRVGTDLVVPRHRYLLRSDQGPPDDEYQGQD